MAQQRVLEPGVPLRLLCQACGYEYVLPWEKGMLFEAMLARLKGYRICPSCGNKSRARNKAVVILPEGDLS